ncbi:hypothetical protein VB712_13295 [Spirulina sp. CCNP1310]|uniref:hypothetical protein n=1 Tax=Spirulina sp. CCNP1310 TaxID=3110249 RepID=UPI002B21A182|nr:hypothetical protein [Spirulina sp. CCNP1310]MEA5420200.1 hypothetical protein [Spirulina sp. CCNP1310]
MEKSSKFILILLSLLGLYFLGYVYARLFVFHAVERYLGAEGKAYPRQDYITKRDQPAGEGWEYQLFLPAIKLEESIVNYFHNR